MGKDIKGKELGKGLSQRKDDKRYVANFYQKDGTRRSQTFSTLQQARTWLADSKYEDAHNTSVISPNMTVNEWYERWAKEKAGVVRPNTMRNYRERYNNDIKPVIGRMKITEVRPIDCQRVLNEMADDGYAGSTIRQTLDTMVTLFWSAFENRVVQNTPVTRNGVKMPVEVTKSIDFFTIEEEKRFIEVAKDYAYYPQFRLILEMGLRTSELVGLTWSCVSLEKREIRIEKTLEYRYSVGQWVWGPTKKKHGKRTLKLTNKAYEILKELYDNRTDNPKTPEEFKDVVFINRTGYPTKNSTYDTALTKRCEKAGVRRLSMHDLRHTMATRFTEQSTDYKRLSAMLGHSSIKITVDTYVHETQDSIDVATDKFSSYLDELFD